MDQLAINKTAQLAAEINFIKEQTARQVLTASIEIGNRLEQAKALVDHGQWETWLQENVSYSQSTAQNLMRIAREYGSNQLDITGRAPADIFGQLTYSQAVALFALPEAERAEFVETHDVTEMSTRELQQAIAEEKALRESAEEKLLAASERAEQAAQEAKSLRNELSHERDKAEHAANQFQTAAKKSESVIRAAKERSDKLEAQRAALEAQIKELRDQPPELTDEQRAEIERQIEKKYTTQIEQLTIDADTARAQQQAIAEEKAALERRIQQENDKRLVKFQALFERLQMDFASLVRLADDIGGDTGNKLRTVIASLTNGIANA